LRAVTLNYESPEEAAREARLSARIAALIRYEAPSVGDAGNLRDRTMIARLIPAIRMSLAAAPSAMQERARRFEAGLDALEQELQAHRVSLDDVAISRGVRAGSKFVIREGLIVLVAGPVALWGWLNHFIPFRAAFAAGRRVRDSAADPAMRTIVAGTAFVSMVYMLQGAAVTFVAGPWWGIAYVISLPIAADINLRLRERLERARRRARTYLLFRARPELHDNIEIKARALREEALALGEAVGAL
jgi:hypothetical protein